MQRWRAGNVFLVDLGLQGVAEGVAEVEQHAVAGLALVARHDRGLGPARGRDRVLAPGAAIALVLQQRLIADDKPGIGDAAAGKRAGGVDV